MNFKATGLNALLLSHAKNNRINGVEPVSDGNHFFPSPVTPVPMIHTVDSPGIAQVSKQNTTVKSGGFMSRFFGKAGA